MEKYSEMSIRQKKVDKLIEKIKSECDDYLKKIKKAVSSIDFENMSEEDDMSFDMMNNEYFYIKRLLEYIAIKGVFMEYEAIYKDKDVIVYTIPSDKIDIFLFEDFNFTTHFLSDIEMDMSYFEEDDRDKSPYKAMDVFSFLNPKYFAYEFLTAMDECIYVNKMGKGNQQDE